MKWSMWEEGMKRKSPWERGPVLNLENFTTYAMHYIPVSSRKRPKFQAKDKNVYLDVDTKRAALKASHSVVALVSYTGEQELIPGSGIIIECDDNNSGIVLTSANLIRCGTKGDVKQDTMENNLADNLKVVLLFDGTSYEGKVSAYDFHYNIASIRFQSDSPLTSAILRKVDDYINVTPT